MTSKEKFLVLGMIALGLVPAYGSYYFLTTNQGVLARLNGSASGEKYVALSLAAENARVKAKETEIYQSKPQKIDEGFCAHSYYTSFVLTLSQSGAVSLMQECESVRDQSRTWRGRTTPLQGVPEGVDMREFSFAAGDTVGSIPLVIRVQLDSDSVAVLESSLKDLATSTRFTRLGTTGGKSEEPESGLRFGSDEVPMPPVPQEPTQ